MTLTLATPEDVIPHPTAPQSVEESGLSLDLILQLVLKTLHFAGELSGTELGQRLGLNYAVIAPAIELLKVQQQVQIVGGGLVGGALVPISNHGQRTHARCAVPGEQPLRRRRSRSARAVSAVHEGVPGRGAAHRISGPRS